MIRIILNYGLQPQTSITFIRNFLNYQILQHVHNITRTQKNKLLITEFSQLFLVPTFPAA